MTVIPGLARFGVERNRPRLVNAKGAACMS